MYICLIVCAYECILLHSQLIIIYPFEQCTACVQTHIIFMDKRVSDFIQVFIVLNVLPIGMTLHAYRIYLLYYVCISSYIWYGICYFTCYRCICMRFCLLYIFHCLLFFSLATFLRLGCFLLKAILLLYFFSFLFILRRIFLWR